MAIAAATVVGAIAIRRKQLFILLMVGAVCLGTSQSVQAQCTAKNEAFQSGEHVMYDLYFNWKFIWKKVGLASLTTNATTYHSEPAFRFNLLVFDETISVKCNTNQLIKLNIRGMAQ